MKHPPTLHVFPAQHPHDDVVLAGDRTALKRLRDALDVAIVAGRGVAQGVFTNDGEGYAVIIVAAEPRDRMTTVPPHYAAMESEARHPDWLRVACRRAVAAEDIAREEQAA